MITPAQAQAVAQAHPGAQGLTTWSEARVAAIYDDPPAGNSEARRMFRFVASGPGPDSSMTFYVDASLAEVARYHSNIAHFDITGRVTGKGTGEQPLEPDTWGTPGSPGTGTLPCPNDTVDLGGLPRIRVAAFTQGTSTIVASAYTDEDGDYIIPLSGGPNVDVKALTEGPYWRIRDGSNWVETMANFCCNNTSCANCTHACCSTQCCHPQADSQAYSQNPVSPSASGVNMALNAAYSEFRTAHVNAHYHIEQTHRHYEDRLNPTCECYVPGLHDTVDVIVNYAHGNQGGSPRALPENKTLWFPRFFSGLQPPFEHPNWAYSTFLSHEYGHYLIYWLREIEFVPQDLSFHEGYADTLALLVQDTSIIGMNAFGCDDHAREPLTYSNTYPDCDVLSQHERYTQSKLLSHTWLDILDGLRTQYGQATGLEKARQLHVDWSLLTDGGEAATVGCPSAPSGSLGRSVHPGTLIEVLTADDDDGDLTNGTPHHCWICPAFIERDIDCPLYAGCGDRPAAPVCNADCDRDGTLTPADFVCFHNFLASGHRRADCDGDGALGVHDFACFASAFHAGCMGTVAQEDQP